MKKILLFTACLILCPSLLWATPRTVSITWTMADTTDVQSYKVYYADNSAMTNKTWHNDCSSPTENPTNTFTINCNNIDLTDNQTYYFTVAAQMTDNSESISDEIYATHVVNTPTKPVLVQDFRIVTPGENIAPVAVITANPTSGSAPLTVSFDASSSTDSDGSVVAYSWDFGDGSPADTTLTPNHIYITSDTYQVSLTVYDNTGIASTTQITITTTISSGELITVTNISPNYPITTFTAGDVFYSDRSYTITSIPLDLQGITALKTANNDKYNTSATFLTFDVNRNGTLYIAYDSGASPYPPWLIDNFNQTTKNIATTNYELIYSIWEKQIQTGTITIPGNNNGYPGSVTSNYFVLIK